MPENKRKSWAEPYKIKMVEPLFMSSKLDREKFLVEAGYNTFLLKSKEVYIKKLYFVVLDALETRHS